MLSIDELIDPDEHCGPCHIHYEGAERRGAPLSRDGDPLAGWEASRQTGREPQHLGQGSFS